MDQIVHNDQILQSPILDNPEIFNKKPIMRFHTILPIKHPMNSLIFLIQELHNRLGIIRSRGRKNIDRIQFAHSLQEFEAMGTHVEFELVAFQGEGDICLFGGEDGMDEGLVEIQQEEFLLGVQGQEMGYFWARGA